MSNEATVSFNVVADRNRGDCNNDLQIDAADLSATQLEIFDNNEDADGVTHNEWWLIYLGAFNGSPTGCDSNVSRNGMPIDYNKRSVDAADLTCTVNLFFGLSCEPLLSPASVQAPASLTVARDLQMGAGVR